jgi:hypothetical protein
MVRLQLLRELTLRRAPGERGPAHLAAASGLVVSGGRMYVLADDEAAIGAWDLDSDAPGELLNVFPEVLPNDPAERKKHKPDLEALTDLPPHGSAAHGALLALGSGSSPERNRGIHWPLGPDGTPEGDPRVVDLGPLYGALRRELPDLDIEGVTVRGEELLVAQRGVLRTGHSALMTLRLEEVLEALERLEPIEPGAVTSIERHDLGDVGGVPLAFTDVSALPDGRVVYSAAAEDTGASDRDGEQVGAAIGVLGEGSGPVDPMAKVEGVRATLDGDRIGLLLVADPDERATPAPLFRAQLP